MTDLNCPTCKEEFGISEEVLQEFMQGGMSMFCPRGHKLGLVYDGMPTTKAEQIELLERMWG